MLFKLKIIIKYTKNNHKMDLILLSYFLLWVSIWLANSWKIFGPGLQSFSSGSLCKLAQHSNNLPHFTKNIVITSKLSLQDSDRTSDTSEWEAACFTNLQH